MIFSFFYHIVLIILFLGALPKLILRTFKNPEYGLSLIKKFGFKLPKSAFGKKIVWIHAVSLGETKALIKLTKELKEKFPEAFFLFTTTTVTGQEEAKKSISADFFAYLPLDLSFIIKPLVKKIKPSLVILSESDFWPNFLSACKQNGAIVGLVNGKLSNRSLQRFLKIPFLTRKIFSNIDYFCLQSQDYKERFLKLGLQESKLHVTGNLKLDNLIHKSEPSSDLRELLKIENDFVITFGSTHEKEEALFADILKDLLPQYPNIKAIFVPRHPERFNRVAEILKSKNLEFMCFSHIEKASGQERVILLNAMGLLQKCYQFSHVAVIGGSFIEGIGGHNILEPCAYNVAITFGPYMHGQPDLVRLARSYQVGYQTDIKNLKHFIQEMLANNNLRETFGKNSEKMIQECVGSSFRTLKIIENQLQNQIF